MLLLRASASVFSPFSGSCASRHPAEPALAKRSVFALARLLATTPDDELRDGAEAVRLVEPLVRKSDTRDVARLEVLAAAYAECGRFKEASSIMEQAIQNAPAGTDMVTLVEMRRKLKLFREKKPLRIGPGD